VAATQAPTRPYLPTYLKPEDSVWRVAASSEPRAVHWIRLSAGHHWYPQDTTGISRTPRCPRTPPVSSGYGVPRTPLVSSGYRGVPRTPRCPQDTAGILKTRCPQDTAVSWGHRILRTPPRVLGHGVPRIPPPVLGISRYPQDAPRVPRRQLAFSEALRLALAPGPVSGAAARSSEHAWHMSHVGRSVGHQSSD
jgi:hypothetical protein